MAPRPLTPPKKFQPTWTPPTPGGGPTTTAPAAGGGPQVTNVDLNKIDLSLTATRMSHSNPYKLLNKSGPRSLLKQVADAWYQNNPIVAGMGLAKGAYHLAELQNDLTQGRLPVTNAQNGGGFAGIRDRYLPEASAQAVSLWHTANRQNPWSDQFWLTAYPKAWREGNIVDTAVTDVGNVALVATLGESALGRIPTLGPEITVPEATLLEGKPGSMTSAAIERAEPGAVSPSGMQAKVRQMLPGKGLAGALYDRYPNLATKIGNVGEGLGPLSSGANTAADPFRALGNVLEKGAEKFGGHGEQFAQLRPSKFVPEGIRNYAALVPEGVRTALKTHLTPFSMTDAGRKTEQIRRDFDEAHLGASRVAMDPVQIGRGRGLSEDQISAALYTVDQRLHVITDALRRQPGYQDWLAGKPTAFNFDEAINGPYAGRGTTGQRPTPEMVRELMKFEDGVTDPEKAAAMADVAKSQRNAVSGTRTERATAPQGAFDEQTISYQAGRDDQGNPIMDDTTLYTRNPDYQSTVDWQHGTESGLVNPSAFGAEMRPEKIIAEQTVEQKLASKLGRQWDKARTLAQRDARMAHAMDALYNELPDPANVTVERAIGKYDERQAAARREYTRAQAAVERAIQDYIDLSESEATPAVWAEAEKRLDQATDRVERIEAEIVKTERRRDATIGLSRATGEYAPGARRVLDPATGEVVQETVNVTRPVADTANMPTGAQIRAVRDERKGQLVQSLRDQAEDVIKEANALGGPVKLLPASERVKGGEWDWYDRLSAHEKRRLATERWVTADGGINVDELPGGDGTILLEKLRSLWDAQRGKGERFIPDIAAELGVPEHIVEAAVKGSIAEYKGLLATEPATMINDLRDDFVALSDEDRQNAETWLNQMVQADDVTPDEFAGALAELLPGVYTQRDIEQMLVSNNVDMRDLTKWILYEDHTESLRALLGTRTPSMNKQIGRYSGLLEGLHGELRGARREEAAGVRSLSRAAAQGDRAQAHAAATIEAATTQQGRVEARQATIEENLAKLPVGDERIDPRDSTWRRFDTQTDGPISPGERARQRQGAMRRQAELSERREVETRRAYDRAQARVGDVPQRLNRTVQTRLQEDVNSPAIARTRSAVVKGVEQLGDIKGHTGRISTAVGKSPRFVTGVLGRLANKYGVSDQMIKAMEEVERFKAIEDGWEPGTGPMPKQQLEPTERAAALHMALNEAGKQLEDWEGTTLNDSMEGYQLQWDIDRVLAREGMNQVEQPGIINTGGGPTGTPGAAGYKPRPGGKVWTGQGGRALLMPEIIHDLIGERSDRWNMPEPVRTAVATARQTLNDTRTRFLSKINDDVAEAMPATRRAIHINGKLAINDWIQRAVDENAKVPGSGDVWASLAWEAKAGLDEINAAGLDISHMVGGEETTSGGAGGTRRTAKLRAGQQLKGGLREVHGDAYARVEAKQADNWLRMKRDQTVTDHFGVTANELPAVAQKINEASMTGRTLSAPDIAAAAKEAGYVPLHRDRPITTDTVFIPKKVYSALNSDNWWENDDSFGVKAYRQVRRGNRFIKGMMVGASTKVVLGNVLGNIMSAWTGAGVSPLQLASQMHKSIEAMGGLRETIRHEGMPSGLPAELTQGLTQGEFNIRYNRIQDLPTRRKFSPLRVTDAMQRILYPANAIFDNLTKSSTYLAQLGNRIPREEALKTTQRALGNYNKMTPFEKRVLRETIPFYAWLRHSTAAALRLPFTSPMRFAMMHSLAEAMSDPDVSDEMQRMIGGKFKVGNNNYFDIGGWSPIADITPDRLTPFDPSTIGSSLTPLFKGPFQFLTGVDPAQSWDPTGRPGDTGDYGRSISPLDQLKQGHFKNFALETTNIAAKQIPQTRGLLDLAYGPESRYGTGYPNPNKPWDVNRTWPRALLRTAGLPSLYSLSTAQLEKVGAAKPAAPKRRL